MNREWKIFAAFLGVFLFAYFVPLATPRFDAQADPLAAKMTGAIVEAFLLLQWYARNHTLACVVPALFIAGAITTFLSKESVLKHLGPKANKVEAYSVASVSGTVLAVCSCSVLPMFAGIYRIGAGLGPAACFLYAGPAINVLAIFLTARVLGFELGVARVIGAMVFGVIIGLLMAVLFRRSEDERSEVDDGPCPTRRPRIGRSGKTPRCWRPCSRFSSSATGSTRATSMFRWQTGSNSRPRCNTKRNTAYDLRLKETALGHQASEVVRLAKTDVASIEDVDTWVTRIHHYRWYLAGVMGVLVVVMSLAWLNRQDFCEWMGNTWEFSKLLVPLLFGGVFVVGFLGALIPENKSLRWWATTACCPT